MILQRLKKHRRYVLIDIDTQRDFLLGQGKACVRNHSEVLANIRRIMAWCRRHHIRVISTAEVHPNNNGASVIPYCIDGTAGQKKISYTLLSSRASFPADDFNTLPAELWYLCRQVVLHKRCTDPFDERRIDRLLSEVQVDEFVLMGVCAEEAVQATALGLLQRGRKVSIVVDALGWRDNKEAKLALRKMKAKGAKLVTTEDLAGSSHLSGAGACKCETCRKKRYIQYQRRHLVTETDRPISNW
jgi:nicotinamidase-related amidase